MGTETLVIEDGSVQVRSHDLTTNKHEQRMILADINLTARQGDIVGIIGKNGAGKSTLLRVCNGSLALTSGTLGAVSRPHLLAIGPSLRAGLSGRQNIEIGLYALGFSQRDVRSMIDDIADFTDLGEHLNFSVNNYSSGMRARLGFAITTAITPEILLIDEALAVGDTNFRARCLERIKEISDQASTILMATHRMSEVVSVCTRCIWLDDGKVAGQGKPREVVKLYQASQAQ